MVHTPLEFADGSSVSVDTGMVADRATVGVIVKHAAVHVAIHLSASEARAHARGLLETADKIDPPAKAVASQPTPPDRVVKP